MFLCRAIQPVTWTSFDRSVRCVGVCEGCEDKCESENTDFRPDEI